MIGGTKMVLSYNTIKKLISKNILIENGNTENIHTYLYNVNTEK